MTVIPAGIADRQKLKSMLTEMTHCLARMDAEKDAKKDIADAIKEKFELKPSLVNKLARTMYKRDYADLQSENEDFEILYETLVEGKKTTGAE
jgi:ribosomal protein L23